MTGLTFSRHSFKKRNIVRMLALLFGGITLVITGTSPEAAILVDRPVEPGGAPTEVYVQAALLDVDEVDAKAQSFTANFFLHARWKDARLAHKKGGELVRFLREVWNPGFQLLNQKRIFYTFPDIVKISPDGTVVYQQRIWGSFSQPMDLREFPFDRQVFEIRIVDPSYGPDEVKWIPDPSRQSMLAPALSQPDWNVESWRLDFSPYTPLPGFEPSSSFAFVFKAKRKAGFFLWKILLPLIFIVAMSWIVFWIDPELTGPQISVATTSMLTLIAYRFVIGQLVPNVSYLTRMDYFILGSTVLVFSALLQAVVTSVLAKAKRIRSAQRIDSWCRILFPALFAGVLLYSFAF